MNIVEKKIVDITPYDKNPRNNIEAVKFVKKSIKDFGFKVPIVLDKDNVIVAGHTRFLAAIELGMESVPCIIADDLTDEQVKAFRLADNKVGEKAQWDYELLYSEIDKLGDFNFEEYGFDDIDVDGELSDDFVDTKTDPGIFGVTLTFTSDNKQLINRYIKKNGKEYIVHELMKLINETTPSE